MGTMVQKKFSITDKHRDFLENYRKWGFSDQSSIVRKALSLFIRDLEAKERKRSMERKAKELLTDYTQDEELTSFTDLDGNDFHEAG